MLPTNIIHHNQDFVVFPLQENSKLPACKWRDEELPEVQDGQNYGIDCERSGLTVIDIDGEQGIASFEKILETYGEDWPKTYTVQTPRGGYHLYFLAGDDIHNAVNGQTKIDVRGVGGYVAGPGSSIDGKPYTVVQDHEIAKLPDFIIDSIIYPKPDWGPRTHAPVNGQDDHLRNLVWKLRNNGVGKNEAYTLWQSEVDLMPLERPSEPWTVRDFNRHWNGADRKVTRLEVAERVAVAEAVSLFEYKSPSELSSEPFRYTIEGVLPVGCNFLFSAYAKAGKTTTTLNLIKALTTHDDFLGQYRTTTVGGNVVYVNLELDEIMLRQYLTENGIRLDTKKLKILNLRGSASSIKILNDGFVEEWAADLKKHDCEVLIIDPLAPITAVNGYDSDDNDGVRRILENFGHVQQLAGIEHLGIIDHTGHEAKGRARGASAKLDWADGNWNQERKDNGTSYRVFTAFGRGVDTRCEFVRNETTGELEPKVIEDVDGGDKRLIISLVTSNPGISTTELKERTGINSGATMSRRLAEYEAANLITRTRGSTSKQADTWCVSQP